MVQKQVAKKKLCAKEPLDIIAQRVGVLPLLLGKLALGVTVKQTKLGHALFLWGLCKHQILCNLIPGCS